MSDKFVVNTTGQPITNKTESIFFGGILNGGTLTPGYFRYPTADDIMDGGVSISAKKANVASPALTGNPTAPTQVASSNGSRLATTAHVKSIVHSYLSKDITGHSSVLTLTADESYSVVVNLTGTLNQNLIIDIAQGSKHVKLFTNATSGAYTLSIRIVGQSNTYEIKQGYSQKFIINATEILPDLTYISNLFLENSRANTQPVDTNDNSLASTGFVINQLGTASPLISGVASAGVSTRGSREDHVHPTDTTRAPLNSPAFTGTPTVPTATVATNTTQGASTAFVHALLSGPSVKGGLTGGTLTLAAADCVTGFSIQLQGALTSNLVVTFPTSSIAQRPFVIVNECTGNYSVRAVSAANVNAEGVYLPYNVPVFIYNNGSIVYRSQDYSFNGVETPNEIINGSFSLWRRGTSQSTNGYGSADRWYFESNGNTHVAERVQSDLYQGASCHNKHCLQLTCSALGAAENYTFFEQRIEGVKSLSGGWATICFETKSISGNNAIAVELAQSFGTGGSPSSAVTGIGSTLLQTVSNTWKKHIVHVYVPSVSGKTIGSDENDYLSIRVWLAAGSSYLIQTAGLSNLSTSVQIANFIVCEGIRAPNAYKENPSENLIKCQRYYRVLPFITSGYGQANYESYLGLAHGVAMRATPTIGALTISESVGLVTSPSPLAEAVDNSITNLRFTKTSSAGMYRLRGSLAISSEL